ncbi:hypothetical protein L1987_46516 [Smallanthus sonchifolius]|uniref:Uncharacterized protein n=1 Tax=Smallanthus sonchifolius TaxID=185202 RepID=A0ACB9G1R1_9ASTR|nr:hypothetical protein L1987_46516 [Smallanthus sonchifolius]
MSQLPFKLFLLEMLVEKVMIEVMVIVVVMDGVEIMVEWFLTSSKDALESSQNHYRLLVSLSKMMEDHQASFSFQNSLIVFSKMTGLAEIARRIWELVRKSIT